jgi:hypothetical protein
MGRSVALTVDPARHAERILAAAQANLQAGAFGKALDLLAMAETGPLDNFASARVDLLRGQIAFASGPGSDAPPLLLTAAKRLEPLNVDLARETYLSAWMAALFAGRLAGAGDLLEACRAVRALPPPAEPPRTVDLMLDGLALIVTSTSLSPCGPLDTFRGVCGLVEGLAYGRGDRCACRVEGFGIAEGAGEYEGSLESGDHRDGEAAGGRLAETMPSEENGSTGDPVGEDVGGGLSQMVIGAGHLQGDGGDRAGVGVVAGRQVLGGQREGVRDRGLQVLVGIEDRVDEVTVERPGGADHLLGQLLLAAGKEVVERAELGPGRRRDLLHARAGVAVAPEHLRTCVLDAVPGMHCGLRVIVLLERFIKY